MLNPPLATLCLALFSAGIAVAIGAGCCDLVVELVWTEYRIRVDDDLPTETSPWTLAEGARAVPFWCTDGDEVTHESGSGSPARLEAHCTSSEIRLYPGDTLGYDPEKTRTITIQRGPGAEPETLVLTYHGHLQEDDGWGDCGSYPVGYYTGTLPAPESSDGAGP